MEIGAVTAPRRNWVAQLHRFVEPREVERCDLCAGVIPAGHAHLLEHETRRLRCVCQGCALSLGASARFCLVPPRAEKLPDLALGDAEWAALQIPIEMAFIYRRGADGRAVAVYPGPAGATEAALEERAWSEVAATHAALADFAPDVEALLINRIRGARECYRVSIDRCYSLVGLIRRHWRGLSGGAEAWDAIDAFFAALRSGEAAHG
ncbi:MAG TPA: DUF5947 family protein [Stellaceae bacterium]|jgi:hypothetical protein|nr:DUF5947 family protein [Stellaceae bacterium]